MPPVDSPINFTAFRRAMVASIARATGLPNNHIVQLEPEQPNWPRPPKPYMSFKVNSAAMRRGTDVSVYTEGTDGMVTLTASGQRIMNLTFACYAVGHETSYNIMSQWQACLDMEHIQAMLRQGGMAVWEIGDVQDLSMLLDTAYEGRAQLDCRFGVQSLATLSGVDIIQFAPVDVGLRDSDKAVATIGE